ncbi:MAG: DUF6198 family protein [Peptostreptococcaceae bacterium]
MKEKRLFSGELALILGLVFNSFSNTLMVKSGMGISAISSVSYSLSLIFDKITLGTWNYIFQGSLILILVLITKKFKIEYIICFFLAVIFGNMMDFFDIVIIQNLPVNLLLRIIYFIVSFILVSVGISFLLKCTMPVLPIDTFTRDLTEYLKVPYQKIKTIFDLSCLGTTIVLTLLYLDGFRGIGIGTIACALITGKVVSRINDFMEERFYFKSTIINSKHKENEEVV